MVYGIGAGMIRGANGRYHQTIGASIPSVSAKRLVRHHKAGIACKANKRGTILSIYHEGQYCRVHEPKTIVSPGDVLCGHKTKKTQ